MRTNTNYSWLLLCVPLFCFYSIIQLCFAASDTLSTGYSLSLNQTLVSKEGNFELGFFKPGTSTNYYIGIWYKKISIQSRTLVWVANRDNPITQPPNSELKLLETGKLVLTQSNGKKSNSIVWSTRSISKRLNSSELVLGDDGNLVLRDGSSSFDVFWQSFDHPTDTWLPGGKLRYDKNYRVAQVLTSWKKSDDPTRGMFSVEYTGGKQYSILWNGSITYWSSGIWDGKIFANIPEMKLTYINNFSYISNENESYLTYSVYDNSTFSRLAIDVSGQIRQYTWLDSEQTWSSFWSRPRRQCEVYGFCGAFGSCDERGTPFCQCLPGFDPRSSKDWNLGDHSGGCVKNTSLECGDKSSFLQMFNIKLPENAVSIPARSAEECKLACLTYCSCNGYSYHSGCLTWNDDLFSLQQLLSSDSEGRYFYLRFYYGRAGGKQRKKLIIILVTVAGLLFIGTLACILLMMKKKRRWMRKKFLEMFVSGKFIEVSRDYTEDQLRDRESEGNNTEILSLDFETITILTNDFTDKLGEGGYGPVYKGKLQDGQEVAVKRLSRSSGQGIEEFKNELKLISKLQHRNLVRLLGFCVEREEKILFYEYMPNKSLDVFLFDLKGRAILDWSKRFNIVNGIARGLLYLHRDSRLRVIHRDLKASNVLLDEDMNPKISDFGMARMFSGDQLRANTNRVVGTYGYMSPEYAMGGLFSEKSDIFSFGVLLLEIVSSKKNTSFYHNEKFVNLLAYAWELWNEGKSLELMDPILIVLHTYLPLQVLRCIQVGLLCVEEHADDRPTMSAVVSMLGSETILPTPKQPAFTVEAKNELCGTVSLNDVTLTAVEGR